MRFQPILFLLTVLLAAGCKNDASTDTKLHLVNGYINTHLAEVIESVEKLNGSNEKAQNTHFFRKARAAYKKVEPFLVYIVPKKTHGINGPPLPVYREDSNKVLPAIGFQALEEQLYGDERINIELFDYRVKILLGYLNTVRKKVEGIDINARRFFVPIHQQFLSIFSLGLISFDTPASLKGLDESIISLESIHEVYALAIADTVKSISPDLHQDFVKNIRAAVSYLETNKDFETFDRYDFTRNHLNKLTTNWRDIRKVTQLYGAPSNIAINLDAPTFFEENSFRISYFTNSRNAPSEDQVILGKRLFSDPKLSKSGNLSCASCHQPTKAYQDGLALGKDKDGNSLKRNTPTIINSALQKKFFLDGRADNLKQQIHLVFENELEFDNATAHDLSILDLDSTIYNSLFAKAFPDTKTISKKSSVKALTAYVSTLNALNSRFDKNLRGELDDFSEEEVLGMNLYMGKALCATCHFLPLTNGTVPPIFRETEKEVIGTPKTAENKEVDDDLGFYWVFQEEIHKYMFKTPTIRNIAITAPYMHNGVYNTLEEVVDFYNKGGGGGMGFDLPYQTLPFDSLALSQKEQNAIIAFMKTFTDTEVSSAQY